MFPYFLNFLRLDHVNSRHFVDSGVWDYRQTRVVSLLVGGWIVVVTIMSCFDQVL